ncbi:MAG: nucleoside-triphosphatase [Planctomycetota bacterium]|jgi:nucleoside-triphosphatase THEP1
MAVMRTKLILWTGEKHSGKTTNVAGLVETARADGFDVAGVLSPSVYYNGKLFGFDVLDLRNEVRAPLARRKVDKNIIGKFDFLAEGLEIGNTALSEANTDFADLIIIDEFGPLELEDQGWRKSVDSLIGTSHALMVIVVRQELADLVQQLYGNSPVRKLCAAEPESIDTVITMLRSRRSLSN